MRAARASILVVLVSVLSGCGLAGNGFQPGVAVVVEDRTVSQSHISELTHHYCRGIGDVLKEQDQQLSLRYLSSQVVVPQLSIRLLVEEFAEDLGVESTEQYRSEVSALRARVAELDDEAADAVVEVESARSYYLDILTTIGRMQSGDATEAEGDGEDTEDTEDTEGEEGGEGGEDPEGADGDNLTAGRQALSRWMADGDAPLLSINPRYGLRFAETEDEGNAEGPVIRSDTDISYPSSDLAKGGLAPGAAEDPAYLADLPTRMVCG